MNSNTQQKINMALSAINYLTNNLNVVNTEMAFIPSSATGAQIYQDLRVAKHVEIESKLNELANELGDYFNEIDALSEEDLLFINPIFEFINSDEE